MARIRVRRETGTLFLDVQYRGARCRERTALPDTPGNRKVLDALAKRIDKAILKSTFEYAEFFKDSPRAKEGGELGTAVPYTPGPRLPRCAPIAHRWPAPVVGGPPPPRLGLLGLR